MVLVVKAAGESRTIENWLLVVTLLDTVTYDARLDDRLVVRLTVEGAVTCRYWVRIVVE